MTKHVLDIAVLEVFLKGLPSHCCLFTALKIPPLDLFAPLVVALEGSKLLAVQFTEQAVQLNWTSRSPGDQTARAAALLRVDAQHTP